MLQLTILGAALVVLGGGALLSWQKTSARRFLKLIFSLAAEAFAAWTKRRKEAKLTARAAIISLTKETPPKNEASPELPWKPEADWHSFEDASTTKLEVGSR